jgi:AcrR family transcriptional regulator
MEKDAKEKLLAAALPLFPQYGYAGVSIRAIAEAAGVNSAAISYYFGGKEGLYGAVLERLFVPVDKVVAAKPHCQNGADFVHLFAERAVAMHKENPYLVKYMYMEMINPTKFCDSIVKKHLNGVYQFLSAGVQQAVDQGEFRPDLDVGYAAFFPVGPHQYVFCGKADSGTGN